MHARDVAYMVDNCSVPARLGARKWGPRFQAACEQVAFPTFDDPHSPDPRPVDAFRKNPVHEALTSLAPLRPPVDISV
jgi:ketol-acid reductoisomerase